MAFPWWGCVEEETENFLRNGSEVESGRECLRMTIWQGTVWEQNAGMSQEEQLQETQPPSTEPQAFLCEMGHHPQGASPRVRAPTALGPAAAQTTRHFAPLSTRSGTSLCHLRGPLLPNLPKSKVLESSCVAGALAGLAWCSVVSALCSLPLGQVD